jgi:hypothetical protein
MDYTESDNLSNKKRCYYRLKKNGKTIYQFDANQIECVINNIKHYDNIFFPNLYAKNENDILKKLLIIHKAKIYKLNYYLIEEKFKYNKKNGKHYYIFNNKNIDKIINHCFYKKCILENKNIKNFFYGSDIKMYSTLFLLYKVKYFNVPNNKILNYIFYEIYLKFEIKSKIYSKYGKKLTDFPNYNKLYLFLKSTGDVNLFYNKYAKIFIKNYHKFYLKYISLKNNIEYKDFETTFIKKIKNFENIDILDIIDNNINDQFDKKYIKNKFLELTKNIEKI